ncbi:unnamed protein product [Paramecium sonneborni]|uniref:Uncharacterized protein n=1 Tax=Paramecium sonneborni TaxID=65129 RepID=A0A8S1PF01_9CILI|nr:unnamed protein product [Paramecium sonneborni]
MNDNSKFGICLSEQKVDNANRYIKKEKQKKGKWIEVFDSQNEIYMKGEYLNNLKVGCWETIFKDQIMY